MKQGGSNAGKDAGRKRISLGTFVLKCAQQRLFSNNFTQISAASEIIVSRQMRREWGLAK